MGLIWGPRLDVYGSGVIVDVTLPQNLFFLFNLAPHLVDREQGGVICHAS
jgi:hypothetical protein